MKIRVNVIENNNSSFKFSINKRDAIDLGLVAGQRWEIDVLRYIDKDVIKKEIEERSKKIEVQND